MKRLTDVTGKQMNKNGGIDNVIVGGLYGHHSISSNTFEVLTLEFDPDYIGSNLMSSSDGEGIFTYVKTTAGSDRDIVSPICVLTSSYTIPLYVLSLGTISKVEPPVTRTKGNAIVSANGSCDVTIVKPGRVANTISEWNFRLPFDLRVDRKVIYIKKFDMYISGCSSDQMMDILNSKGNGIHEERRSLVSLSIKANISYSKLVSFCFNGIPGRTVVEPSRSPMATITLDVAGEVLVWELPNKDILSMDGPMYHFWPQFGGIELVISDDYEAMIDFQASVKGSYSRDTAQLIQDMQNEISGLNEAIIKKDQQIEINRQRLKQEEHKSIREEIKLKSDIASNRHSEIIEWLKIGGAVMGTVALIINVVTKMNAQSTKTNKTSNIVEWSIPMIVKRGAISTSATIAPAIATAGCGLLVSIGMLAWMLVDELEKVD